MATSSVTRKLGRTPRTFDPRGGCTCAAYYHARQVWSWEFFSTYVDEVYAIADPTWINAKGTTPGGLTTQELEAQMQALKGA